MGNEQNKDDRNQAERIQTEPSKNEKYKSAIKENAIKENAINKKEKSNNVIKENAIKENAINKNEKNKNALNAIYKIGMNKSTVNKSECSKIEKNKLESKEEKADKKSSVSAAIVRDLIARMTADRLLGPKLQKGEIRKNLVEPAWKCPACFHVTQFSLPNCPAEMLSLTQDPRMDRVILQLHGGGYIGAMCNRYRSFAGLYNELGKGNNVFTPDYRVAPEHPYPAALEDAVAAYQWLLGMGWQPDKIVVAGDSAGGGLALALCMYLKDHGTALPEGLVLMSPWTDLTASGESYEKNFTLDPLFGNTRDSMIYNLDYVGEEDPQNPYISPLFGDFHGFPPMLIQVGSIEMLLSDSVSLAKKAREAGVKIRLSVYEEMFHVFQTAELLLPESRKAWEEVGKFLRVLDRMRKETLSAQEEETMYSYSSHLWSSQ